MLLILKISAKEHLRKSLKIFKGRISHSGDGGTLQDLQSNHPSAALVASWATKEPAGQPKSQLGYQGASWATKEPAQLRPGGGEGLMWCLQEMLIKPGILQVRPEKPEELPPTLM